MGNPQNKIKLYQFITKNENNCTININNHPIRMEENFDFLVTEQNSKDSKGEFIKNKYKNLLNNFASTPVQLHKTNK